MSDVDDILELLNEQPDGAANALAVQDAPTAPKSPTALKVDRWGMGRAKELTEAEWNQTPESWDPDYDDAHVSHDAITLADSHAACFEPQPQLAENPENMARAKWFEQLLSTPDYQSLHASTCMDAALSEIGAKTLADKWTAYYTQLPENDRQQIEGGGEESIESEMRRIRSCQQAANAAQQDVGDAQSMSAGLGMGDLGGKADSQAMLKTFQKVRSDRTLRRICELAGRYRRLAQSKQRKKVLHGVDDMVGIELGGDVGRIIPAEAACLVVPELELDALRRIAERQALQREYRGIEPIARGPIVVCVDESGSMSGEPHCNAKAFALALAWVARHQRRYVALCGFSGGTEGTRIALPPDKWDTEALTEWLSHFYGGGTTLDVPLHELPAVWWDELGCPKGKTDVVLITDAIVNCPDDMRDSFLAWKAREKAKAFGIVIGHEPGDLSKVCDQTWCVNALSVDTDAVGECLSI